MKINGLPVTLVSFFFLFSFFACNEDEAPAIQPSADMLLLSGEGATETIAFAGSDWLIAGIRPENETYRIYGAVYDASGELVRENTELSLTGLGRLESVWHDKGFSITRETPEKLEIEVYENASSEEFCFILLLQSQEEKKEITVRQGRSAGYRFEKIEYALLPGSQQKVFAQAGFFTFHIQTNSGTNLVKYNPLQNEKDYMQFECTDRNAFGWMQNEPVEVPVPAGAFRNELFFNSEKATYQDALIRFPLKFTVSEVPINPPSGESKCHFEIEYEEFKASYRLYIKNKATGNTKSYEGVFMRKYPTGSFTLVWDSVQ